MYAKDATIFTRNQRLTASAYFWNIIITYPWPLRVRIPSMGNRYLSWQTKSNHVFRNPFLIFIMSIMGISLNYSFTSCWMRPSRRFWLLTIFEFSVTLEASRASWPVKVPCNVQKVSCWLTIYLYQEAITSHVISSTYDVTEFWAYHAHYKAQVTRDIFAHNIAIKRYWDKKIILVMDLND